MTYNSTTTLERIRAASPCEDGWRKLLAHLGKTKAAACSPLPDMVRRAGAASV